MRSDLGLRLRILLVLQLPLRHVPGLIRSQRQRHVIVLEGRQLALFLVQFLAGALQVLPQDPEHLGRVELFMLGAARLVRRHHTVDDLGRLGGVGAAQRDGDHLILLADFDDQVSLQVGRGGHIDLRQGTQPARRQRLLHGREDRPGLDDFCLRTQVLVGLRSAPGFIGIAEANSPIIQVEFGRAGVDRRDSLHIGDPPVEHRPTGKSA